MQDKTLVLLHDRELARILLALKKRGFGTGKWNGVGGKLESGETIEQAAVRETYEEIGVVVREASLEKCAELQFTWVRDPDWDCLVHVFLVHAWDGEPSESDEVRPNWFSVSELPFDQMWEDDRFWLPRVLEGMFVRASFSFGADGALSDMHMDE